VPAASTRANGTFARAVILGRQWWSVREIRIVGRSHVYANGKCYERNCAYEFYSAPIWAREFAEKHRPTDPAAIPR
jgi:hypothetical protein